MAERRTIGQILMGFGRITEADVARALQHQQQNGGYFGEALLALEMVTQEELEWSLASQFDLPYVFPDSDSIDPDAISLVSPEWALANLTLPIMKTASSVSVIVDSPIKTEAVDELQRKTGLRIELALASAGKIRELIRQVYGRLGAAEDEQESPVPLDLIEFVATALEQGSPRFGISVRGHRATGWYEDPRSVTRRRALTATWAEELDRLMTPQASERIAGHDRATWPGQIRSKGLTYPVDSTYMSSPTGQEFLFLPIEDRARIHERFPPPSAAVLSEVKLLVRSLSVRFALSTSPVEMVEELLPYLPLLLLESSWRSVHLVNSDPEVEDLFVALVPSDGKGQRETLDALRAFHFDAVTAQLNGPLGDWVEEVLDIGRVAFVPCASDADRKAAEKAGVLWELQVKRGGAGKMEWSLLPLRS